MVSMSFDSSMVVILAWNGSGSDLKIFFLTIFGYGIFSPKLKVEFIMSLSLA